MIAICADIERRESMTAIIHTLWHMSFQACFLITIVLIARVLLKKYSGFYTRLLWLLVIVRLLCPVFIETRFSLQPEIPSAQTNSISPEIFSLSLRTAGQLTKNLGQQDADTEKLPIGKENFGNLLNGSTKNEGFLNSPISSGKLPQTKTQEKTSSPEKYNGQNSNYLLSILPALSLIGTLITALVFLFQFLRLRRQISTAICEEGNIWLCEAILSPFVVGIFRPRIILPYHLTPEARAHILSHEQTHIRHHDPLLHMAGLICLCLHWWNPFVWLAMYKMNQDMEMFCDESTLNFAAQTQRKDYAKTLLSFAEAQSSLHTGPAFGESNTERRVKNIMKKRKKNFLVLGLVILLAIFCTAAFMTIPKAAKRGEENNPTPVPSPRGEDPTPPDTENNSDKKICSLDGESLYSLLNLSFSLPNFSSEEDMDIDFWKNYLFSVYTNVNKTEPVTGCKAKMVEHYNSQYGSQIAYNEIAAGELDRATKLFFGKALSEFVERPDLLVDNNNLLYEGGFYYISVSDSPDYAFGVSTTTLAEDGRTKIVFPKYLEDGDTPLSEITLYIEAAENDNGYILTGKEERTEGEIKGFRNKNLIFLCSEEDVSHLQRVTLFMPDFYAEKDLNAAFWKDYLFYSYSGNFDGEAVNRYSSRRDMKTAYAKVDEDTLNHEIEVLFGKPLSEYLNPQEFSEENGDIIYEEGNYYIRIPDNENYTFDETQIKMNDSQNTQITYLKRFAYSKYPESQITLFLEAADNETGFILVGKQEIEYNFTNWDLTGSWMVTDYCLPPSAATNLSQKEIDSWIGTQLKFGPDYLMVDTQSYPVTEYQKELVTAREFDEVFQVSTGETLSLSTTAFDHFFIVTDGKDEPFGSHIYRFDFEGALVVYRGVIFRIAELTESLYEETVLDELRDLSFALPDENGFTSGRLIPSEMQPGSIIYYTDDTHYIIVQGAISLDTPHKIEELYNRMKTNIIQSVKKGIHPLPNSRPSDGMNVTYDMYGYISHIYPRDYPQKKLAEGMLNWRYDNGEFRAVASGLDSDNPKIYYQAMDDEWKIFPLEGFKNLTDEERDTLTLAADAQKITVTVVKGGQQIVKEIEVNH